jgi:Secretion system C-terminal sorting domain
LGGVHYNVPVNDFVISILYAFPGYCTTDPIYTNHPQLSCENCNLLISEVSEIQLLESTISPNPAHELITISIIQATNEPFTYTIENTLGELVLTGVLLPDDSPIDVSCLKSGIYLVRSSNSTGEKISRTRFVKV